MTSSRIRLSKGDAVFAAVTYVLLSLVVLVIAYPLIYVVSASFSSPYAVTTGRVFLWPVEFTLKGYEAVFNERMVWVGYANSLFYAVVGTAINIVMTIMAAYPLSRKDLLGRGLVTALFTFTMFFSGGLIPGYLLVKSLGMLDTRWAMLIPGAMSVWNVIIARTYYKSNIPLELLEASQMDGCSNARFVVQVVVPLSGPITAVLTLWYAVGHWNAYFGALIYLTDTRLYPLQLILRDVLVLNLTRIQMLQETDVVALGEMQSLRELLKYSLIIVASLPVILLYPLVQKYFVKGIMIGSLKG